MPKLPRNQPGPRYRVVWFSVCGQVVVPEEENIWMLGYLITYLVLVVVVMKSVYSVSWKSRRTRQALSSYLRPLVLVVCERVFDSRLTSIRFAAWFCSMFAISPSTQAHLKGRIKLLNKPLSFLKGRLHTMAPLFRAGWTQPRNGFLIVIFGRILSNFVFVKRFASFKLPSAACRACAISMPMLWCKNPT